MKIKGTPNPSKTRFGLPKILPREVQTEPKASQESPKAAKGGPKGSPRGPKGAQKQPKRAPGRYAKTEKVNLHQSRTKYMVPGGKVDFVRDRSKSNLT